MYKLLHTCPSNIYDTFGINLKKKLDKKWKLPKKKN